jgi:fructose-bisphosphate aldolase class II
VLTRPANVHNLNPILDAAEHGGYAVGSFSPRSTAMILPVLQAAQALRSPLIVQISQKELVRHQLTPKQFADTFYAEIQAHNITVPVALHLDHTRTFDVIQSAIAAGFTSVMMDASEKAYEENIAASREVAQYAHPLGVSVEAELGRITTTDFVETDEDKELYTDPQEAGFFIRETGVDALAVSVGTAHGVYLVRQPKIDYERLTAIRTQTSAHLVLHGGSGVPAAMIAEAVRIPGGGVSKVNIATDLELAALEALQRDTHLTDAEMNALPPDQLALARDAVEAVVRDKISHFLNSSGRISESSIEAS